MKQSFLTIILLFPILLPAQTLKQSIRGSVIDKDSKSPLPGANVIIAGSNPIQGTVTDIDGNFRLDEIPLGRHTIRVTFLGYKEKIIPEIEINSGKEVILIIEMEEKVMEAEVTIVAKKPKDGTINEMAVVSTRTFSVEETNKYAGSWGDPARMAANFAGVTSSSDQRNDIVVRGNSPIGILWRLDGVEIPNPNHFSTSGSSGGGISMLNNNLLDNSDFMTSAFPAEYGNATSGVFDLRMRKGNDEKREHIFQIGVNGFELGTEGPFMKNRKASYLLNYRYSTLGVLNAIGALDFIGAVPDYQDLNFKVHFPVKSGTFSLFGMGGKSEIVFEAEADSALWVDDPDAQYRETAGSETGVLGLVNMHFFSDKAYLKTIVSSSVNTSFYSSDVYDENYALVPDFNTEFKEGRTIASMMYNRKINARNTVRAGTDATFYYFDIRTDDYLYAPGYATQSVETFVDSKGDDLLLQSYLQWKHKPAEKLTLNGGLHYMLFLLNDRQAVEPRLSAKWQFSERQSLNAGFGQHSKLLPLGVYFGEVVLPDSSISQANTGLDFFKSRQMVLGYDLLLGEDLRLKAEAYYQHLWNVPVSASSKTALSGLNSGVDFENIVSREVLSSSGTGRNYGVEITFEKFLSRGYYFLGTGSLYESKYTASDGVERNTAFNGKFAYHLLGGKEFKTGKKKNHVAGIYSTIVNVGGQRFTPIDLDASKMAGTTVRIDSLAFSEQHPAYFRADIRLSYRLNFKKMSHELAFEAKNIFNTQNIFFQYYNDATGEIETLYQAGLFPILIYRLEF